MNTEKELLSIGYKLLAEIKDEIDFIINSESKKKAKAA
jgi:hypothetical protein